MAEAHRGQPAPRAHTIIIKIMNHSNWSLLPPRAHMCHIAITLVVYIMHQCSRRPCLFFILYNERERAYSFFIRSPIAMHCRRVARAPEHKGGPFCRALNAVNQKSGGKRVAILYHGMRYKFGYACTKKGDRKIKCV
jgi:hypothetical protein